MNTNKTLNEKLEYLKTATRSIKDYPKEGIIFRDLTTIFQDAKAMRISLDLLEMSLRDSKANPIVFHKIVGIEARGFVLAGGLSGRLGGGVVLARKPGKLPYTKKCVKYELEYGEDALEMHVDTIKEGDKIIIVDDLLATGGTAEAACKLVENLGGDIVKILFVVELPDLLGRKKLSNYIVESLISFSGI